MNKIKMAIVMRSDLNMTAGKMIAMAGHAVTEALATGIDAEWFATGMKKVALEVDSEAALLALETKANKHNVPIHYITDAGLTQNEPGTLVCCAIGPATEQKMKKITGSLKLL